MTDFKPGDKVRCINPPLSHPAFKKGWIYTVTSTYGAAEKRPLIGFREGGPWFADRFELVEPESTPKPYSVKEDDGTQIAFVGPIIIGSSGTLTLANGTTIKFTGSVTFTPLA